MRLHNPTALCTMTFLFMKLAVSASTAQAVADDSHDQLLQEVKNQEQLFKNIEVSLRRTYKSQKPTIKLPSLTLENIVKSQHVNQSVLYYKHERNDGKTAGGEFHRTTTAGYDGKRLVSVSGKVANINYDQPLESYQYAPHTMLLERAVLSFPLSSYLQGGNSLKRFENYNNKNVRSRILGQETLSGLNCYKISVHTWSDGSKPEEADERLIWLAIDRNLFPIRTEWRDHTIANGPIEVGVVSSFSEIANGIWYPMKAEVIVYNINELRNNRIVAANTTTWTVDKADPNPNYPASFFRDIEIPDKTIVYEIKNRKTMRSYRQSLDSIKRSGFLPTWMWMVFGLFGITFLWFVMARMQRIRKMNDHVISDSKR